MSDGMIGIGTLLKLHDGGSPGSYTTIAEVADISGPSMSADSVEFTNHSSPNNTREFKPGLVDPGELTFTCNYIPDDTTQGLTSGLAYLIKNRVLRSFELHWPDGTIWTFDAFVTAYQPKAPIDDKLSLDVTLKLTGFPVES